MRIKPVIKYNFDEMLKYANEKYKNKERKSNPILLNQSPNDKRVVLVALTQNFQKIQEYYTKHNEFLTTKQKIRLIKSMYSTDQENTISFINSRIKEGELYSDIKSVIKAIGLDEEKLECNILKRNSIFDFSSEELENSQGIDYIEIPIGRTKEYYLKEEVIRMRHEYDKMFGDIPHAETGNAKNEYNIFMMTCEKIFENIAYHHQGITKKGEKNIYLQKRINSLYNALVEKKCVCGGLARVLELVLNDKGINSKSVAGFVRSKNANKKIIKKFSKLIDFSHYEESDYIAPEDYTDDDIYVSEDDRRDHRLLKFLNKYQGGHVWNQVTIGGHTFNCDITADEGASAKLYSDEEFDEVHGKHYRANREKEYNESARCDTIFEEAFPELIPNKKKVTLKSIKQQIMKVLKRDKIS